MILLGDEKAEELVRAITNLSSVTKKWKTTICALQRKARQQHRCISPAYLP